MEPAYTPSNESIHAWLVRYIRGLTMVEALDFVAEQLRLDVEDGFEYTKHADMAQVRKAWGEQILQARQEQ